MSPVPSTMVFGWPMAVVSWRDRSPSQSRPSQGSNKITKVAVEERDQESIVTCSRFRVCVMWEAVQFRIQQGAPVIMADWPNG